MIRAVAAALAVAFALAAAPAMAEKLYDQVYDLGARAPVAGDKTWADLLRQIFPEVRQEADKDGKIGYVVSGDPNLRPINKDGWDDDCRDESPRIAYLEYAIAEISDRARLVVGITTENDGCFGALALFDGLNDGKLLDAANIQQDLHYAYGPDFVRQLGHDGQLVIADNFHLNSGESFYHSLLILVTADRLSWFGDVEADGEWDCEHHRGIAEEPYVVVTPDYGAFDRITGYIKRTVQPTGDDCRTPKGKPKVTITRTDWRWDAAQKSYRKESP